METEAKQTPLNIILLGHTGSGKTSLGKHVAESMIGSANAYFSQGEYTRKLIEQGGPQSIELQNRIKQTGAWDPEFVLSLIEEQIISSQQRQNSPGIILDGMPRSSAEAELLINWATPNGIKFHIVLELLASEESLWSRLNKRTQMGEEKYRVESQQNFQDRISRWNVERPRVISSLLKHIPLHIVIDTEHTPAFEVLEIAKSNLTVALQSLCGLTLSSRM